MNTHEPIDDNMKINNDDGSIIDKRDSVRFQSTDSEHILKEEDKATVSEDDDDDVHRDACQEELSTGGKLPQQITNLKEDEEQEQEPQPQLKGKDEDETKDASDDSSEKASLITIKDSDAPQHQESRRASYCRSQESAAMLILDNDELEDESDEESLVPCDTLNNATSGTFSIPDGDKKVPAKDRKSFSTSASQGCTASIDENRSASTGLSTLSKEDVYTLRSALRSSTKRSVRSTSAGSAAARKESQSLRVSTATNKFIRESIPFAESSTEFVSYDVASEGDHHVGGDGDSAVDQTEEPGAYATAPGAPPIRRSEEIDTDLVSNVSSDDSNVPETTPHPSTRRSSIRRSFLENMPFSNFSSGLWAAATGEQVLVEATLVPCSEHFSCMSSTGSTDGGEKQQRRASITKRRRMAVIESFPVAEAITVSRHRPWMEYIFTWKAFLALISLFTILGGLGFGLIWSERQQQSRSSSDETSTPSSSLTEDGTSASFPTGNHSDNCFQSSTHLKLAVNEYIRTGGLPHTETVKLYGFPMNQWCVSKVKDFSRLFESRSQFNEDLSNWDMSSATDISRMFAGASSFNQNLEKWNVSNVEKMYATFASATAFNGNISTWDVSKVTTMDSMFYDAPSFTGDVSSWNVSRVTSMSSMFHGAVSFNSNISQWDVHSVADMSSMFESTAQFNANLSLWDVAVNTDMRRMFFNATAFKKDYLLSDAWGVGLDMFKRTTVKFTFALVPKSIDNPFFDESRDGCLHAAGRLGIQCLYIGPSAEVDDADGEIQAETVNRLVEAKAVDALAISVKNAGSMTPIINKAVNAGIPVVTFDSDAADSLRSSYIGTNNTFFGVLLGKIVKKISPEGGTYGIISEAGAPNIRERQRALQAELHSEGDGRWVEIIGSPSDTKANQTLTMQQMHDFAVQNPTVIVPVMGYPMRSGKWVDFVNEHRHRNIKLVNGDAMELQLNFLKQAFVDGLVGQLPYDMGKKSMEVLYNLMRQRDEASRLNLNGIHGDQTTEHDEDDDTSHVSSMENHMNDTIPEIISTGLLGHVYVDNVQQSVFDSFPSPNSSANDGSCDSGSTPFFSYVAFVIFFIVGIIIGLAVPFLRFLYEDARRNPRKSWNEKDGARDTAELSECPV